MAQSAPNPPADNNDAISNAVVSPQASLFVRQILKTAIDSLGGGPAAWALEAKALLANVMMNDYLNSWNQANNPVNTKDAQDYVNQVVGALTPPDPVLAQAYHAQGLIYRAQRTPQGHQQAYDALTEALSNDGGFARAHAQLGNQKVLLGQEKSSHDDFNNARKLAPRHPAWGYFDWGEGRACFQEAASASNPDWSQAINLLTTSVKALPTVWYNQLYLACAQDAAGQAGASQTTLNIFLGNPSFGPMLLKQLAASQAPPDVNIDPPTVFKARTLFYNWLQKSAASA